MKTRFISHLFIALFFLSEIKSQDLQFQLTQQSFEISGDVGAAFADVDGDLDQDLLLSGIIGGGFSTQLYLNDGIGHFIKKEDTPFLGLNFTGDIAFADVDNDQDMDVLITGMSEIGEIARLYTNDGLGEFTEVSHTPFEPIQGCDISFTDIDGDSDLDLFIAGIPSKLFINDGLGNFAELMNTPFKPTFQGAIACADVDGDEDIDLMITGETGPGFPGVFTWLYINEGAGSFREVSNLPITGVAGGRMKFVDIDADLDQDIMISGHFDTGTSHEFRSRIYTNNGNGHFSEFTMSPFDEFPFGEFAFSDLDNDLDQDIIINELMIGQNAITLYRNNGAGNYEEVSSTLFQETFLRGTAFADIDGDADQDVLLLGEEGPKLYRNGFTTNVGLENEYLEFQLFQNQPNPFTNYTMIQFELSRATNVQIEILDLRGKRIAQLLDEYRGVGQYTLTVDLGYLASGIYIYRLQAGPIQISKKMTLIR